MGNNNAMKTLEEILATYDPIGLKEMDAVKLMDRTDTKFTFKKEDLPSFLDQLNGDYRVLEVADNRICGYETLYFDTPTYNLYLQHHNMILNRYKVRYRCYTSTDSSFFEVKIKNNKNRTVKERIATDSIKDYIEKDGIALIKNETPLNHLELIPSIWVHYSRITLVNKYANERLTLDLDLTFNKDDQTVTFPGLVIAELKQEKINNSPFLAVMKNNYVRTTSISKYCFGVISLVDNIKMNNFKQKVMSIHKLCQG